MTGSSAAGRVVLVAGASRGIGAAIAEAFADEGARRVVLAGRTRAALEEVARRIEARAAAAAANDAAGADVAVSGAAAAGDAGADAAVSGVAAAGDAGADGAAADVAVADLTDPAQSRELAARVGAIDVLVVNAGTNQPEPFLEVTEETFDRLLTLNVRAGFFLAQAVAPSMPAGGCIVFVSSQMGHVGAVERTVYCATKHAVEGLVKAMALELAPRGVRVVSVAPTFVHTEMTARQLDDPEVGARLRGQIPLGRPATAAEVADAVTWIASPRAAMTTGASLLVDGGWTAR